MILEFFQTCWDILRESAPWMFVGFFMTGLLRAFVPENLVARHLGVNQTGNVIKAALFGVPLPLCSCAVIPAAAGLRRQGASKGATASFLISTPETGVDSIAVTWAMLDPLMTVIRPVAAFCTAMIAGLAVNAWDTQDDATSQTGCGLPSCSCHTPLREIGGPWSRFVRGQRFAFGDLFADIGVWFAIGVAVAALITMFLPADLGRHFSGNGFLPMLGMLAVALPMYVCATASTPIAAALALKGVPPGALLVFLLAGPATNAATVGVVTRLLGKRAAMLYVGAIIVASLGFGLLVDMVYLALGYDVHAWLSGAREQEGGLFASIAAGAMLMLLVREGVLAVRRWKARRVPGRPRPLM